MLGSEHCFDARATVWLPAASRIWPRRADESGAVAPLATWSLDGGREQLAARPVDTRIPANSRKRGGGLTGRGDGAPALTKRRAEAAFCRLTPGPQASCFLPLSDHKVSDRVRRRPMNSTRPREKTLGSQARAGSQRGSRVGVALRVCEPDAPGRCTIHGCEKRS
jgi:hypothetical protein